MEIAESERELKDLRKEQKSGLDELNETYEKANEKYQSAYDYTEGLTGKINENTESTNENTESKKANIEAENGKQAASASSIEIAGQEIQAYKKPVCYAAGNGCECNEQCTDDAGKMCRERCSLKWICSKHLMAGYRFPRSSYWQICSLRSMV